MAFLGKEYKCVKQENYAGFLKSLELSDEKVEEFLTSELSEKIVQNADSYTVFYNTPLGKLDVTFKPGVEVEEPIGDGSTVKSVYKIDGNAIHQVSKGKGIIGTFHKAYNGNDLVITMTSDKWDGIARTYYKA